MAIQPITSEMRANFKHLYADILWFGVLAGSAMAFVNIYATRLGATSFQISLLTAAPAVINLLLSIPAGRWLEGKPLVRVNFISAVLTRLGYLALVPLPWLFPDAQQIWMIIWITLLMSLPGTILAIGFIAMFAEVVPPDWRAEVVGKRNAITAVSMTVTTLLCGLLLNEIVFPLNYQIVFGIGAFGALMSAYHVGRLRMQFSAAGREKRQSQPEGILARIRQWRKVRVTRAQQSDLGKGQFLRLDLLRGPFGRFMLAYLLFYTFQYLCLPLFPIAFVRQLGLTDGAIGLGSALFYSVMFLVSLQLSRLTTRLGHRKILVIGTTLFGFYPLLIGLSQGPFLYYLASFLGGGVWALTSAGLVNRLMERVPDEDRPSYLAQHNLALNLGILAGSLAGPLLNGAVGLREALVVGAGLRFLAGFLMSRWG